MFLIAYVKHYDARCDGSRRHVENNLSNSSLGKMIDRSEHKLLTATFFPASACTRNLVVYAMNNKQNNDIYIYMYACVCVCSCVCLS